MPAISGQKTVTSAGTAVPLGAQQINGPVAVKALDTNTGVVAIGGDGAGDVTTSNGYRLMPGDERIFIYVSNLEDLMLDSATNGDGVSWIILKVV